MSLHTMASTPHSRLLAIFAHPDDEVFCAGGILAQWTASGGEAMVISATRGEAGQIQDGRAATRSTLGDVREQELRDACTHLGVQQVRCLDYRDGTLQDVDQGLLARAVEAHIRAFGPDVVVTFGPDGGYGHPDHVAISDATTRACRQIAETGEHAPQLNYAAFPRRHRLLCHRLARWLLLQRNVRRGGDARYGGSDAFVRALTLLAEEATLLGYADDSVEIRWFPAGVSLVEQGERASSLYLIIAGHAEVIREGAGGPPRTGRRLGPGRFFGEAALARRQPHRVSLVAIESVACLVLSARVATPYDGRGGEARLSGGTTPPGHKEGREPGGLTHIDVAAWLDRKLAALAAHRTQFVLEPATFPSALLAQWLGHEYFVPVALACAECDAGAQTADGVRNQAVRQRVLAAVGA